MRSPTRLLRSGSGTNSFVVAWTVLAFAGLAVVEFLNWTAFQPSYRTEDDPADGITVGAAIVFVLLAFLAWCLGLVVIAVIRERLKRRKAPDSVALTYDGKLPG